LRLSLQLQITKQHENTLLLFFFAIIDLFYFRWQP